MPQSVRSLDDIQDTIDTLFSQLEDTDNPGKVQQLTHALRHQITQKANAGGRLHPREQALVQAVGSIRKRRKRSWGGVLFLLVVIALAAIAGWWWVNM